MDKEAVSNRSLFDVTGKPHDRWERIGDVSMGRRVREPFAGSIKGYQWLGGSHLRPVDLYRPEGANFNAYATRWERRYSALIPHRTATLTLVPVVHHTPFFSTKLPG